MSIEAITLAKRVEGLIPRDRFVLFVLADYANDDLEAWPRQATIASDTGYNRTTVNRALKSLEEGGLLTSLQEQRGDGGNSTKRYRLNLHNLHPPRSDKIGFEGRVLRTGAPGVASVNRPLLQRSTPPVASVNSPLLNSSTPPVAAVNSHLLHSSTASNKEELPRRNYQKNLPPPTPPTAPKPSERGREGQNPKDPHSPEITATSRSSGPTRETEDTPNLEIIPGEPAPDAGDGRGERTCEDQIQPDPENPFLDPRPDLAELRNESPPQTLRRKAPEVGKLFEDLCRLKRVEFRVKHSQASVLVQALDRYGAERVEQALRGTMEVIADVKSPFMFTLSGLKRMAEAEQERAQERDGETLRRLDYSLSRACPHCGETGFGCPGCEDNGESCPFNPARQRSASSSRGLR